MVPVSGGQYRFVTAFAPADSERFLSYCTGWICSIGWQARFTLHCYVITNLVQSLVQPDMAATRWQTHLSMILIALVMSAFNAFAAGHLSVAEGVCEAYEPQSERELISTRPSSSRSATSLFWCPFLFHSGFWHHQKNRLRTSSLPSLTMVERNGRRRPSQFSLASFRAYSSSWEATRWHTLQRKWRMPKSSFVPFSS